MPRSLTPLNTCNTWKCRGRGLRVSFFFFWFGVYGMRHIHRPETAAPRPLNPAPPGVPATPAGAEFGAWGLGFGVWGLGFGDHGSGSRLRALEYGVARFVTLRLGLRV